MSSDEHWVMYEIAESLHSIPETNKTLYINELELKCFFRKCWSKLTMYYVLLYHPGTRVLEKME